MTIIFNHILIPFGFSTIPFSQTVNIVNIFRFRVNRVNIVETILFYTVPGRSIDHLHFSLNGAYLRGWTFMKLSNCTLIVF